MAAVKWGALSLLAVVALISLLSALLFWRYSRDPSLPNMHSLSDYKPLQVTRILTEEDRVVGEVFTQRRRFIPYEEIPQAVIRAFVAAEDAEFFHHEGIDYVGVVRALFVNVLSASKKQGASTITQQVVKTFFLTPERTFRRKFQEIILARRLEAALSKEEILTLYLNQIYFGHGRYGIVEAARFYFGKTVPSLTLGEIAALAGLPQAPERISPHKNRERAKARQKYVLEQMVYRNYLGEEEAKRWIDEPIAILADPFPHLGIAPDWVQIVKSELTARFGADALDTLGADVVVTLDAATQELATEALRAGLRAIDERLRIGRRLRRVPADRIDLEVAKLARRLPKSGPAPGEVYPAVVVAVRGEAAGGRPVSDSLRGELEVDLGRWRAAVPLGAPGDQRFNPEGKKPGERFARGDLIRVLVPSAPQGSGGSVAAATRQVVFPAAPEGAVVVLEPDTRRVRALVGGYNQQAGDFNRATMARRQAGSTFKPFVYAVAIDSEQFTAASIVNDAPEVYDQVTDLWKPENYDRGKFQGPVRLRHGLAHSINTVAIRVIHEVGPERVASLARDMGIRTDLPAELSLGLGAGAVTPLDLTNAFATFAAQGQAAAPHFIARVNGQPLRTPVAEPVLRPEVAYIVTDMMRSVVEEGTGARARALRFNLAGKTGTSNDARDAWFMGMTPDLVVGVWVGFDDNRPLGDRESGSRSALPIYVDLMERLDKKAPVRSREFARPPGVVEARVDRVTGLLAPANAPIESSYPEVFIAGTEPAETAPAPGEIDTSSFVVEQYDAYDDYDAERPGDEEPRQGGPAPPARTP